MFERFTIPGSALGVARFFGLLGGVALIWACAVFGVMVFADNFFVSYGRTTPTRMAHRRILDVESGITRHQIVENRCPTPGDLIRESYTHPRDLVDPWGTSIAYWCHGEDVEVRSAGPDKLFNTADDITHER